MTYSIVAAADDEELSEAGLRYLLANRKEINSSFQIVDFCRLLTGFLYEGELFLALDIDQKPIAAAGYVTLPNGLYESDGKKLRIELFYISAPYESRSPTRALLKRMVDQMRHKEPSYRKVEIILRPEEMELLGDLMRLNFTSNEQNPNEHGCILCIVCPEYIERLSLLLEGGEVNDEAAKKLYTDETIF
ncbi:hypothetical protein [Marinicrinis lubricantis]|uniref:N-acetyltransferase domain-containing protein n=1 Tax=Marinicrinis lubricantis TaxID=2086470 RepID=A0ABW1ITS0_9BACL